MAVFGLALGVIFTAASFGTYLATHRWPLLVPAVLTALANMLHSGLVAGVAVAAIGAAILGIGGIALLAGPNRRWTAGTSA